MNQTTDYYQVLQVRFGADKADIISSYRRLCKLYHPDISHDPGTDTIMKEINLAYYILRDDLRREQYNKSLLRNLRQAGNGAARGFGREAEERRQAEDKKALDVINAYFGALLSGGNERAYEFLSAYDRQYVTQQSFVKWRRSVQKLFSIRDFKAGAGEDVSRMTLENGETCRAKKHYICVTEKNMATQETESYQAVKYTILEKGEWRVFLGYRDLNEIAKMFEDMSSEREKDEMARHWEEYCSDMCRDFGMFSLQGLLKEAEREVYRYTRYRRPLTIASLRIGSPKGGAEITADALELAAREILGSLRSTDIPAYIGDGMFVVLFVELKKRHAESIIGRISSKIETNALSALKMPLEAKFEFLPYDGGEIREYIDVFMKSF